MDPKTVVCTFYKQGNCEKGKKCKFSHDLSVERKGEKKNLYQDTREGEDEAKKKDEMDNWDEGQKSQPLHASFAGIVVMMYLEYREITASRPQQTRESQNHHRQGLQILHQRRRRR